MSYVVQQWWGDVLDSTGQSLDGKNRVTCNGLICYAPLMAKCFSSYHYPFKHKDRICINSECLQLSCNYGDEQKALKRRERALWKRQERKMDRQKCQHGADKVFEIKGKSVSGEWVEKIVETVHEKWQMGTNERQTGCEWYEERDRGTEGEETRGRRSITPSDGVADWCCRANAELLKPSLMDGSFAGRCLYCG